MMVALRQAVHSFEGTAVLQSSSVLGGKGAGLAEMARLDMPVPPGFTIASGVSRAYWQERRLPNRLFGQLKRGIAELERQTGRIFGDPDHPLLISVRSGAAVSMPGMMDTILNVGLDPKNLSGLTRWGGKRFSRDTRDRFVDQWVKMFGEEPPSDAWEQLYHAIEVVLISWHSERATMYRRQHDIPDWWGTAVNVQAMVFGNLDDQSCTGVVFSSNVTTGEEGLYGEFLPKAQGEDVVAGVRTPLPIAKLWDWNEDVYHELEHCVKQLAEHIGDVVDVEFTVERGKLYILQYRRAKRSPLAEVTLAVRRVWAGRCSREEAVASVSPSATRQLRRPTFSDEALASAEGSRLISGLAASPGAAVGEVVFSSRRACDLAAEGRSVILVRDDTSPEDLPGMLVASAIVTASGGETCHAAVVARELGIPAVVGARHLPLHGQVSVDGTHGTVYAGALPLSAPKLTKEVNIFLKWEGQRRYTPRIDFESIGERLSANELLNDFYLSEAMFQHSSNTALEERVRTLRNKVHRQVAESFAAYLLLAIGGEIRHISSLPGRASAAAAKLQQLTEQALLFNDRGRTVAQEIVLETVPKLSDSAQIEFVESITTLFAEGSWSDGNGGQRWASIARTLLRFMQGQLTPTVFVDAVFDLRHNGGRLFDKHPMFTHETNESLLFLQLEVKKSQLKIGELYRFLLSHCPDCSGELWQLWNEGLRRRIW